MTERGNPAPDPLMKRRTFLKQLSSFALASLVCPEPPLAIPEEDEIFDLHQHGRFHGRSLEQLVEHARANGVTKVNLLPAAGWQNWAGMEESLEAKAKYPDLFTIFCNVDPEDKDAVKKLEAYKKKGCIGLGEQKFKVAVDSHQMLRLYEACADLDMPVLLHFEYGNYNTGFERFPAILKAYPKTVFIGHAQTWWANISSDAAQTAMYPQGKVKPGGLTDKLLADYENVYADLSAFSGLNALRRDEEFSYDLVRRHRRKLLWGSDCPCVDGKGTWPDGSPKGCYARDCLALLRKFAGSVELFRDIVYRNAARVLKLDSLKGSHSG